MHHLHKLPFNPHQRISALGKARIFRRTQGHYGGSLFSSLRHGLKSLGKVVLEHGKIIAPHVLKAVAPHALTLAANKLGQAASRHGVPAGVVNALSSAAQRGARHLEENIPTQKLSPAQAKASSFLSGHAQNVLGKLQSRGTGIYGLGGSGIYGLGRKGGAVDLVQADQNVGSGLSPPGLSYGGGIRGLGIRGLGSLDLHSASRISGTNI